MNNDWGRLSTVKITLPPAEELSARLDRAFWDNSDIPDTLSSSLCQLPRSVTIAMLVAHLKEILFDHQTLVATLGCCISDAKLVLKLFRSQSQGADSQFDFTTTEVQPDSREYEIIANAAPTRPDTIPLLVSGLGGNTISVVEGAIALAKYGPLSISHLLDRFSAAPLRAQGERAKILEKIATFFDDVQCASILRIYRVADGNDEFLQTTLMSTVLKAWRSNPTLEDMEQALRFAEMSDSASQLRPCLLLAKVTSPEEQSFLARLLTLVENWGPGSIQEMLDEVMPVIGLLYLKSLNGSGDLKVTFQSINQKLTLSLQFSETLYIYSLLERRIGDARTLPPSWLPYLRAAVWQHVM
jgi:hypothetical protein